MLQEVLRIHQNAITNLTEDMSFFGKRIEALTTDTERNRDVTTSSATRFNSGSPS